MLSDETFYYTMRYRRLTRAWEWVVYGLKQAVRPVWWVLNLITTLFHELGHAVAGYVFGLLFLGTGNTVAAGVGHGWRSIPTIVVTWLVWRLIYAVILLPRLRVGHQTDGMTYAVGPANFLWNFAMRMSGYLAPVVFGLVLLCWAAGGQVEVSVIGAQIMFWLLLATGVLGLLDSLKDIVFHREPFMETFAWLQIPLALAWGWAVFALPAVSDEAWLLFLTVVGVVILALGVRDAVVVYWSEWQYTGAYEGNDFQLLEDSYPGVSSLAWANVHAVMLVVTLIVGVGFLLAAVSSGAGGEL